MKRMVIRKMHKDNIVHENVERGSIYVVDFYDGDLYFGTKKFKNVKRDFIDKVEEYWVNGILQSSQIKDLKETIDKLPK